MEFTETGRGLDFLHPVAIDFLDEEELLVRYETDTDLSDEDRREIEQITTALRALGLVPGELDLLAPGTSVVPAQRDSGILSSVLNGKYA